MKLVEFIEVEQKRGTEIRSSIAVYCFSYHHAIMQDCGITNDGMDEFKHRYCQGKHVKKVGTYKGGQNSLKNTGREREAVTINEPHIVW